MTWQINLINMSFFISKTIYCDALTPRDTRDRHANQMRDTNAQENDDDA
jgi:hypothetical protein